MGARALTATATGATPGQPAARLILLPLGIAWGLLAEWIRLRSGWSWLWVIGDFIPGVLFLVAGQVAWARRPESRIGPLMVAAGFAWYVGTFAASQDPLVDRFAGAFQGYYDALLAWLVLAYPTGRLPSRPSRIVIAAWFAVLAARSVFRLAVIPRSTDFNFADPAEVERYIAAVTLRDQSDWLFAILIAALAIAALILVVRRLATESAASRRVAGPILLGGIALSVGIVVELVALSVAGSTAERVFAWDFGAVVTNVTTALVPIGFVVGLTRSRFARGSVADLVVELDEAPERPALRDVLAKALGDPSLAVAYAVPGADRFVDADGQPFELPAAGDPARVVTRLESGGRTLAALVHDPALVDQPELVRSVGAAARLAIENERLAAEVRNQLMEVSASRARIVAAGDEERGRIERNLHDGAQQQLVTLALTLQMARSQVDGTDPRLAEMLDRAGNQLDQALQELRELARGLHPTLLAEEGLAAAVDLLADRSPVSVVVDVATGRWPGPAEATAFFVVAEALTNVAKYANATSASVRIRARSEVLSVEVIDDGVGGADPAGGSGLRGLEDRVAALGGRLVIDSPAGAGTTVRAEIPCG